MFDHRVVWCGVVYTGVNKHGQMREYKSLGPCARSSRFVQASPTPPDVDVCTARLYRQRQLRIETRILCYYAHYIPSNMAAINWRTINIDALDPDSSENFDLSTLTPGVQPVSTSDVQQLAGQIRQLLRGGDQEGALTGALENAPYGADAQGKVR